MADSEKRRLSLASNKRKSAKLNGKERVNDSRSIEESERESSFSFKVLSESQTKQLLELDVDDVQRNLMEIMCLPNYNTDLSEASQLDYFVTMFWWAKEQGFKANQASAFYTAANILLMNVKEKHMQILDNINELREMFAGVSVAESEKLGGLCCFDASQALKIAEFFNQTLFQHYRLYQFVFSHTQAEEIIGLDLTVDLAKPADIPYPAPLDEGLPFEVWEKYIKIQPPPLQQESKPLVIKIEPQPKERVLLQKQELRKQQDAESRLNEEQERLRQQERAEKDAKSAKVDDLLASMTKEEIGQVVQLVTTDAFKNLSAEMAAKLRDRENTILGRINKIHKVASSI